MAQQPPPIHFEDIPLDEARRGNVSDLDFLWNVCHADASFCRGNGEGGIQWYSCRFFVPTVKVIGW